jgi:hypothetical protein
MGRFDGKIAAVAGQGISEARVSCFVAEGARVAFHSAWQQTTHRRAFM